MSTETYRGYEIVDTTSSQGYYEIHQAGAAVGRADTPVAARREIDSYHLTELDGRVERRSARHVNAGDRVWIDGRLVEIAETRYGDRSRILTDVDGDERRYPPEHLLDVIVGRYSHNLDLSEAYRVRRISTGELGKVYGTYGELATATRHRVAFGTLADLNPLYIGDRGVDVEADDLEAVDEDQARAEAEELRRRAPIDLARGKLSEVVAASPLRASPYPTTYDQLRRYTLDLEAAAADLVRATS